MEMQRREAQARIRYLGFSEQVLSQWDIILEGAQRYI